MCQEADYVTDDMEHRVPELIEFASMIMTLYTGNVIACGTNHEGLGPLQDGEFCEIELEKIGRMGVHVHDPLKRQWERSVFWALARRTRRQYGERRRSLGASARADRVRSGWPTIARHRTIWPRCIAPAISMGIIATHSPTCCIIDREFSNIWG